MEGPRYRRSNHDLLRLHLEPRLLRPAGDPPLARAAQTRVRHRNDRRRDRGGSDQVPRADVPRLVPPPRRAAPRAGHEPHRQPHRAEQQLLRLRGLGRANPGQDAGGAGSVPDRQQHRRRRGPPRLDAQQGHPPPGQGDRRPALDLLLGLQKLHPRLLPRTHRRQPGRHALLPHLPLLAQGAGHQHHARHPRDQQPRARRQEGGHDCPRRRRGEAPYRQRVPDAQRRR